MICFSFSLGDDSREEEEKREDKEDMEVGAEEEEEKRGEENDDGSEENDTVHEAFLNWAGQLWVDEQKTLHLLFSSGGDLFLPTPSFSRVLGERRDKEDNDLTDGLEFGKEEKEDNDDDGGEEGYEQEKMGEGEGAHQHGSYGLLSMKGCLSAWEGVSLLSGRYNKQRWINWRKFLNSGSFMCDFPSLECWMWCFSMVSSMVSPTNR